MKQEQVDRGVLGPYPLFEKSNPPEVPQRRIYDGRLPGTEVHVIVDLPIALDVTADMAHDGTQDVWRIILWETSLKQWATQEPAYVAQSQTDSQVKHPHGKQLPKDRVFYVDGQRAHVLWLGVTADKKRSHELL